MKHLKKFFATLLTVAMVMAMTVTAFAENGTYSISITNSTEGHTYEAYQIFAGDLSTNESGEKTLSNIAWGTGVSEEGQTALGDAAARAEALENETDAKAFAKAVAPYLTTPAKTVSTITDGKYVISGLAAGYYLVKDQDNSLIDENGNPINDAYTEYIIKVVGDVTTAPKSDVPEVEKKVKDINDSTGEASGWQDSADYDIGDTISFQLKATLADNVSAYTTYKVVFHDTLSAGLTYNNDAKVLFNGTDVTSYFTISENNGTLTISCDNVKAFNATDSSVITVEYTATLNANAVIGSAGNPNKVYLEYSNNPNNSEAGNNETGNTPEDTVIVFTYKVIVNKKDGDGNPLSGAEFTLEKYNKDTEEWKAITVVKDETGTIFTFSGLDDGSYRLTETKTPAGYNTIDPIEFTVTADHEVVSDSPVLTSLSGSVATGELSFTPDTTDGSLSADVLNNAGSTLPETGGMGTTIFYILGTILVAGAAILLITKRRMSAEK